MIRDDGGPSLWGEAASARVRAGQPDDGPERLSLITGIVIVVAGLLLAYAPILLGSQAIYRTLVLKIHGEPVYLILAAGVGLLLLAGIIYVACDRFNWRAVAWRRFSRVSSAD
jgi:hypothetical protein